ncbi:hypothetical protein ACO0LG_17425 [Undibacterium sp. Ji42W]|uniref:hypothetical protein n=1 Tax=Undibacterium sp. Ji42W TaxID=3413039 RepID=UPI003BF3F0B2
MFEKFSLTFPSEGGVKNIIDVSVLVKFVEKNLGVSVPAEVVAFWDCVGAGYLGDRILYVYGDGTNLLARDSFQEWNKKDFWQAVHPAPQNGGPVFFAETCFGDQLGFRWDGERALYVLFCVDTFEAFTITDNGADLFSRVLSDKYALLDEQRFAAALNRLGPLRTGMHYAPIVSPMIGGSSDTDNLCFETPNVHFRTAIATYNTK